MHELDAVQRTANIIVFMIWQWKKYNLFTQKKSNQFRLATFLGFNSKPSFACKYIIRMKTVLQYFSTNIGVFNIANLLLISNGLPYMVLSQKLLNVYQKRFHSK